MNSSELTLNQLLFSEEPATSGKLSGIETSDAIAALKKKLQQEARVKWPVALGLIAGKLGDLLDIRVLEIMGNAWKKYAALLKYADRQEYPPTDSYLVFLAEHVVKSEHRPSMEIVVNNQPVGKVNFSISVSLALKGVVLRIQDARIMEATPGSCKGKGTLKCESVVVLERETGWISLPGSVKLGNGIPISP